MFPEIVVIALPEETSAPDAEAVLAACSQAYLDGDCQLGKGPDDAKFIADVRWLDETHAEVVVRFAHGEQRSAARNLEFQPGDAPAERYRSLGFAAGSLAGTLAELERIQAEARAQEQQAEEELHVAPKEPLVATPLEPPAPVRREEVQTLHDAYRLGLTLASGIDAPRMGLSIGARAVWTKRWLMDAQASVGNQSSNADGIESIFLNGFIGIGMENTIGPIIIDAVLGPALQWQRAKRAAASTDDALFSPGGELALGARYARSPVAPFVEIRGGVFRSITIQLDEDEARSFGPLQLQGVIGVSFTRSDE